MTQREMRPFEALMVMARIGQDPWDQLNWFMETAQKNLDQATEGEKLSLQEELAALELTTTMGDLRASGPSVSLLDWQRVKEVQETILKLLTEWVDMGRVSLQLPQTRLDVRQAASNLDKLKAVDKHIPGQAEHISRYHFDSQAECLLFRFYELFKNHASAITRCPHCSRIFLKLRRHARYCSRKCHSVAGMREQRAQERNRESQQKTKPKGRRTSRRRKTHGQKKR